jgi:hypothetical protein
MMNIMLEHLPEFVTALLNRLAAGVAPREKLMQGRGLDECVVHERGQVVGWDILDHPLDAFALVAGRIDDGVQQHRDVVYALSIPRKTRTLRMVGILAEFESQVLQTRLANHGCDYVANPFVSLLRRWSRQLRPRSKITSVQVSRMVSFPGPLTAASFSNAYLIICNHIYSVVR